MTGRNSHEHSSLSFSELIEIAKRENWCVSPGCTTCGAKTFRIALKEIQHDDIIAGLRMMTDRFLSENSDMFRLIIAETSAFGFGGELLEPLVGTPAADQLRANIDYQNRRDQERLEYAASQTPEAIAQRRLEKKAEGLLATAPHRERKAESQDVIRAVAREVDQIPAGSILAALSSKEFGVPLPAIGGLVYKRLVGYYRVEPILTKDLAFLSSLAQAHAGYWKKLFDRLSHPVR